MSEKKKSVWSKYTDEDKGALDKLAGEYIDFISRCKTERKCVKESRRLAEAAGYRDLAEIVRSGQKLAPGAKVYAVNMGKAMALFNLGGENITQGLAILGAHIDSCRLDVKQNPLYEDGDLAYLDTHYYGGIKKYQWVGLPLAIHGVVVKKDGQVIDINIGEEDNDPVFCVTDLLIHLAGEQLKKAAAKVVEGESLDILIGNYPAAKETGKNEAETKESVKTGILRLLEQKYNLTEDDFISAELAVVPAGRAREMGLDRSLVLGYGQDDRVCAYTSLMAMLAETKVERTTCCLLVDKEEIGSVGATGMQSRFFENTLAELLVALGETSELSLRRTLANSRMLSSDVSAGFDPLYAASFDKKNTAYLGRGMVFNKFTGARGKSGSNDANAEYLGKIRGMMDKHKVSFQLAELGKVDQGGGGTIAYIMSLYGMNVIDSGVAVLSMHAPWEVTSKIDIYETYRGYRAFLREA